MDWRQHLPKLLLIATSIGLALLSFTLSKQYLATKEATLTATINTQYNQRVQVIVANVPLIAGTFVNQSSLAVAEVPEQFLPSDAIFPEQFGSIDGLEIKWDVPVGKPLLQSYLGTHAAQRFSDTIPAGHRAMTLAVNTLNSNENMIEVGDMVDLFDVKDSDMTLIREQVRVIATGNLRSASLDPDGALVGDDSQFNDYQSITLLLPTDTIAAVHVADQSQRLLVLLRNPRDDRPITQPSNIGNHKSQVPYVSNKQSAGQLQIQTLDTQILAGDL